MPGPEALSAETRRRIFDAVQAELLAVGLDRFSIDGVACRAEVEPSVILVHWHDRRVLLMDVMLARTAESEWNPDTGTLYTDLQAVATLAVKLSETETGRAGFRRVLPGLGDADLGEIGRDLWAARFREAAQMLYRAATRGQLRDGVVPEDAIRMFAAAVYHDVIFADVPVRPDYLEQVVDIFLHGVLGAAGRDRPWPAAVLLETGRVDGGSAPADQAVEAVRRAAGLVRAWADALPDAVVLYEAVRDDQAGVVDFLCRDLNRAACAEVGLPRAELLGRSVRETLPNFESSGLMQRYAACLDGGEPLLVNDFPYLHFDQQRLLDIRAATAGHDLITVTWRDVTDRFEAAQREERYRRLMDFSTIPAALATADGRLVSVNQAMASMLGYDMTSLLEMSWQDLVAAESIGQDLAAFADMLAGRREAYRAVTQYVHADGHRVPADLTVSCIRGPDGSVEHLIAQMIDLTGYTGRD